MADIKEIFTKYGQEYIQRYKSSIPNGHVKVINAITNCRSMVYGAVFYKCKDCGEIHSSYRSCGNRHCPSCQNHKTKMWIYNQLKKSLPCSYFLITFTVPQEIRDFFRSNQKLCYSSLFRSSSESIKKISPDKKYLGGDTPGFFGVLHTWGRQIQYHPHIHYVVPGGAFNKEDSSWNSCGSNFGLPVRAISKIFRAKFKAEMIKSGIYDQIPSTVWSKGWNVNCQAAGNGHNCMKYLSRYVFKVAISDSRIIKLENREVHFSYKKKGSSRPRKTVIDVMEFIRRYLQHVLPSGFMKVRYYGFMHPCFSLNIAEVKEIIIATIGSDIYAEVKMELIPKPVLECSICGKSLIYMFSILPNNTRIIGTGFT